MTDRNDLPAPVHPERTRRIGPERPLRSSGPVVYWMHHALRAHENPALDSALALARDLDRPLVVYQGLAESFPFTSDRHHTFVLEGARDVARDLAEREIAYCLHVEREGFRQPHLLELAKRATVVVTDDFPMAPIPQWAGRLAEAAGVNVLAVDTACVAPMNLVGRSFERAFAFRDATRDLYRERISRPYDEIDFRPESPEGDPVFEHSVPIETVSIPDLVAQCDIDHTIGPVPHTRGGSDAGYARWEAFRDGNLRSYGKRRNNPLDSRGVSRISAYLHYGMVSPFRIAREAHATGGPGADKYLDELLIWRELAYCFCRFRPEHETVEALPAWARETLERHEQDPRPALPSRETLARAGTGDRLWDAAQDSLLRHGELHNNVRMTWGKALLEWTADAEEALTRLIDLNHRFALDGHDPCSYGGILWCLGQFDRPFPPDQPVLGSVRPRPTSSHASRLDTERYRKHTRRPIAEATPHVAVIGAGLSGLLCARTLSDHGITVEVFDKGRGPGGRMSTRRTSEDLRFDHGAQYFKVRDATFQRAVDSWIQDGLVARWDGKIVILENGTIREETEPARRYVGVPSMSAIGRHLARDVHVATECRVTAVHREGVRWRLEDETGRDLGAFDRVVVSVPSPQAGPLLEEAPDLARALVPAKLRSCLAVMLAFDERIDVPFDGAFVQGNELGWIARDSSKPGRNRDRDCWVLHASHDWTEKGLLEDHADLAEKLIRVFFETLDHPAVTPVHRQAHLWRFALVEQPLGTPCLFDPELGIGACGDWCEGGRVESAFRSGAALAGRILGRIGRS